MQPVAQHPSKPRPWKVVWSIEQSPVRGKFKGEWRIRRIVVARLDAATAYKLFWRLRGKDWVVAGPEVWRGQRQRVL